MVFIIILFFSLTLFLHFREYILHTFPSIIREMSDLTKQLPEEILEKIFDLLSRHDLCMTVQVCRRWRQVAETPKLWSKFSVRVNKTDQWLVNPWLSVVESGFCVSRVPRASCGGV